MIKLNQKNLVLKNLLSIEVFAISWYISISARTWLASLRCEFWKWDSFIAFRPWHCPLTHDHKETIQRCEFAILYCLWQILVCLAVQQDCVSDQVWRRYVAGWIANETSGLPLIFGKPKRGAKPRHLCQKARTLISSKVKLHKYVFNSDYSNFSKTLHNTFDKTADETQTDERFWTMEARSPL